MQTFPPPTLYRMSSQVVAEFGWRGIAESESLGAGERHGEKQRRKYD